MAEVKSKKAKRLRKRKKSFRTTNSHKHKANRTTTALLVADTHKTSNKNNETLKEENIKNKRIDDVANPYKNDEENLLDYDHLSIESTWSEEEFDGIGFGDKRLDKRFMRVAMEFSAQPQVPINQACEDWADTKATYGLFHNAKVTPDLILAPHQQRTQERMQSHVLVLAVQDTTYFNYTKHKKTRGLGPIGTDEQELRGLVNHTTLAITPQGLPLGVLAQKMWARDDEDQISEKERKNRAIEEKESYKWIESLRPVRRLTPEGVVVVNVCDRESDVYEYFQEAVKHGDEILLRSTQNRSLMQEQQCLWDYMSNQAVKGKLEVKVPAKDKQPARDATVEIRFESV
ncbi:MAG: IS4 family transposase, partial [Planctomycetes bacterium]|nr:IS4 family transposase [Planctomycetota bacterium]